MPIPLLIVSDAVSSSSGLARITRELAARIHLHLASHFTVATLGLGEAPVDPNLPWKQYSSQVADGTIPVDLPHVWRDFQRQGKPPGYVPLRDEGVVLIIGNPSWHTYLSHPEQLRPSELKDFLLDGFPFKKWIYPAIDGDGPLPDFLPQSIIQIIERFDRRVAYTKWAATLIEDSRVGMDITPHLPHGLDTSIFHPRDRSLARATFVRRLTGQDVLVADSPLLVGIVATNSQRKDIFVALEACKILRQRGIDVRIWLHTNKLVAAWNLPELIEEFRLDGVALLSTHRLSDDDMAWCYSACDVTLAPGSEGWGWPIAESLACGVPVVHMTYAGGAEFSPKQLQVEPICFRGDGLWGIRRPVFNPADWADKIMLARGMKVELPSYIDWTNAWPSWSAWLLQKDAS